MQFRLLSEEKTVTCFLKTRLGVLSLCIGRSRTFLSSDSNVSLTALMVAWVLLYLSEPLSRSLSNTSNAGRQVSSVCRDSTTCRSFLLSYSQIM
jgi:hypothetical protein